jgi:hypothetical protein
MRWIFSLLKMGLAYFLPSNAARAMELQIAIIIRVVRGIEGRENLS